MNYGITIRQYIKDKQAPTKDIPVIRTLKDVTLHNLSELLKVNISPKPS